MSTLETLRDAINITKVLTVIVGNTSFIFFITGTRFSPEFNSLKINLSVVEFGELEHVSLPAFLDGSENWKNN